MIGLHGTLRDHGVGPLRQRLAPQEFELARLVAARAKAGAVVALDPELRAAQGLAQPRHGLERRRQMGEVKAREASEMHGLELQIEGGATVAKATRRRKGLGRAREVQEQQIGDRRDASSRAKALELAREIAGQLEVVRSSLIRSALSRL